MPEHLDLALQDLSEARHRNLESKSKASKARLGAIENKNFKARRRASHLRPAHTMASANRKVGQLGTSSAKFPLGKPRKKSGNVYAGENKKSAGSLNVNRNKPGKQLFREATSFSSSDQDDCQEDDDHDPGFGPWSGMRMPRTFPAPNFHVDQTAFPAVYKISPKHKRQIMGGGFVNGV